MKLFEVYTTDLFEHKDSKERVGVYSTLLKAREAADKAIDLDIKVIVESFEVDKEDSEVELEVYTAESGLEFKSVETDFLSVEYGDGAVFFFKSDYYEAEHFKMKTKLIQPVINAYIEWCTANNREPEIDYMENEDFIQLSTGKKDHVLYHAEMQNKEELKELFTALNAK